MAATPHPLVWDFYRTVKGASGLGGVAHYYDESSQSLFLSSGIKTSLADIPKGHWETASVKVAQSIGTPNYSSLELDHAYNGVLFGVAKLGNKIEYLRYVYSFDCSDIISSGSMNYDENNNTSQIQANLMNINKDIFINESTVFQPGARINFKIIVGNETPIDMFTGYLDSIDFNISSKTIPISGRNNIGFKLTQSTFDTNINMLSNPYDVVNLIANLGNISKIIVQNTSVKRRFIFKPDQTLMSGLEQITELFSDWKIIELSDGTIVVGSSSFIKSYQNTGYYIFKKDSLFKRKIKKSCDASYTKVRVTGKDEDDKDLTPVTVNVNTYNQWELPTNKTYHETAPDGLTQSELESYANEIAQRLQYIGIGEDFTCSLQPQICIGDIAAIDNEDDTSTVIGLITSIKHKFGKSGFFTEFSTDSGGLTMEEDGNLSTYTKKYLNGYNRKQTLKDLIQVASGSSNAGPKTSGTVVKVSTNSNASTLEGKTLNQIIDAAVNKASQEIDAVPEYTADDYGKFLSPSAAGPIWIKAESGGGGSGEVYPPVNIVNYAYEDGNGSQNYSRTYEGIAGNRLLLLIMHRGELTTLPEGWLQIGQLIESGDKDAGTVEYVQYVSIFTKVCSGSESFSCSQTALERNQVCVIEFEGVSGFEILEATRQENVVTANPDFTCVRTSTRMAVWIATSYFWKTNIYNWAISDSNVWAISDGHDTIEPRLGVFVDNRPATKDFTISTGLSGRYASILCIQTIPYGSST